MDTIVLPRPQTIDAPSRQRVTWWCVPVGFVAGVLLGSIARGWMRLITDEPEFSWAGTIGILVAFASSGVGLGLARAVAGGARRRWSTVARVVGAVLSLGLFGAAGALMFPAVVCAALAMWRRDWWRWARAVVGLSSLAVPVGLVVLAAQEGPTVRRMSGLVLLVLTYGVLTWGLGPVARPVDDGWRLWRVVRWLLVAAVAALVVGSLLLGGVAASSE